MRNYYIITSSSLSYIYIPGSTLSSFRLPPSKWCCHMELLMSSTQVFLDRPLFLRCGESHWGFCFWNLCSPIFWTWSYYKWLALYILDYGVFYLHFYSNHFVSYSIETWHLRSLTHEIKAFVYLLFTILSLIPSMQLSVELSFMRSKVYSLSYI